MELPYDVPQLWPAWLTLPVPPRPLQVFHYMSIAILTFFMVEFCFKLYVFRLEFFHHKFEILDAIVVVVSFVLDIVLLFREHEFEALGLLILLRLWRVARIINGMSHAPKLGGVGGCVEPGQRHRGWHVAFPLQSPPPADWRKVK